jgi:alpha-amylase
MSRSVARASLAGLLSAPLVTASGCAEPPPLESHVEDWRDEVVYQLLTDRFANGDPGNDTIDGIGPIEGDFSRFQGGDWRGVADHLDYVEALGASTIWISPIVQNVARMDEADGYHGYWASDFTTVEPHFGSEEDLRALVEAAHARDLHVIVDVVTNHTGRVFFYDLDADGAEDEGERQPPYRREGYDAPIVFTEPARLFAPLPREAEGDPLRERNPGALELSRSFFHLRGYGDLRIPEQRRYGDFPDGLRDFDTEREDVIDAHVQTWVTWVLRTDVDGLRLDAVPHAEVEFWQAFCRRLRERLAALGKHRFFLLGEIFEADARDVVPYVSADALDAGFDIPLKYALVNGVLGDGAAPASAVATLETARTYFRDAPQRGGIGLSPWQARVAILDNHDTGRLRAEIADPFAVDQALVAIFTIDAIPCVYYGTEQELGGGSGHLGREPLWLTGYRTDTATFQLVSILSSIRRGSLALRRGSLAVRFASEHPSRGVDGLPSAGPPDAGLLAYERIDASSAEHVLVVLNAHPAQASRAAFETTLPPGRYLDALEGVDAIDVGADGTVDVEVPPRRSRIFVRVR